jgi:hypothetical protein
MTKMEVHFRTRLIAERLRQIEGELVALENEYLETGGTIEWKQTIQLRLATIHTGKAAEELEAAEKVEA